MENANSNSENPAAQDQSTGDLIRQLSEQVSRLVRDELKVAQLEMTRKGKQAGLGIGMLGGPGEPAIWAREEHGEPREATGRCADRTGAKPARRQDHRATAETAVAQ
jgi:hypothetical protein